MPFPSKNCKYDKKRHKKTPIFESKKHFFYRLCQKTIQCNIFISMKKNKKNAFMVECIQTDKNNKKSVDKKKHTVKKKGKIL